MPACSACRWPVLLCAAALLVVGVQQAWVQRDAGAARSTAGSRLDIDTSIAEAKADALAGALAEAASSPRGRIAAPEAELARARKANPLLWREQLVHWIDDVGLGYGWAIVYFSLLPAYWRGQTLGKRLVGLRVMELTGKPLTVLRNLKRYGGYAAGMATGGLGFAQLLWDPNCQAIQDKTAHTVVIDLRQPRRLTAEEWPRLDQTLAPRDRAASRRRS